MRLTEFFDMTVSEFEEFLSEYTLEDIKACERLTRHNKRLAYIFKLRGFPNYKHRRNGVEMKIRKKINKYGISALTVGWPQERSDHIVLTFHGPAPPYISHILNIIINSDMRVAEIEADKYVYLNSTLDRNKTLADYYFERVW